MLEAEGGEADGAPYSGSLNDSRVEGGRETTNDHSDSGSDYSDGRGRAGKAAYTPIAASGAAEFFLHLRLLLWKTRLQFARNSKALLACLLSPITFCAFLAWFGHLGELLESQTNVYGRTHE